jgi:hypothetical protein
MSEQEHWKGKLIPTNKTIDDFIARDDIPAYYDKNDPGWKQDYFLDKYYKIFVVINGFVYKVESNSVDELDFYHADLNDDGSYDFEVSYYNGGCSFDEAIKYAVLQSCV